MLCKEYAKKWIAKICLKPKRVESTHLVYTYVAGYIKTGNSWSDSWWILIPNIYETSLFQTIFKISLLSWNRTDYLYPTQLHLKNIWYSSLILNGVLAHPCIWEKLDLQPTCTYVKFIYSEKATKMWRNFQENFDVA